MGPAGIFLGKSLALAAQLAVLEVMLLGAAVVLYRTELVAGGVVLLVTTYLAATTGLAFVGTLYGGLAAGAKGRETLLTSPPAPGGGARPHRCNPGHRSSARHQRRDAQ